MTQTACPNSIRVAIVEDDSSLRSSVVTLLNSSPGFTCVAELGNGRMALDSLPQIRPDVILMDIQLPKLGGIECVRELKSLLPETPILMFTMFADDELVFDALQAGAVGYLLKRSSPEGLLEDIRDAHNGGAPMSSLIARKVVQSFHRSKASHLQELPAPREEELLQLLAKGRSYKEAAADMNVSLDTVRTYIRRVYKKLQVNSRQGAVDRWRETRRS